MTEHLSSDIITIAIALVGWIIGGITWLARLEMRVRFLQQLHAECRHLRELREDKVAEDLGALKILVAETARDVKWLRDKEEKNGKKKTDDE